MPEQRPGNEAKVRMAAGGAGDTAANRMGTEERIDPNMPEIVPIRRQHDVAGGVLGVEAVGVEAAGGSDGAPDPGVFAAGGRTGGGRES